MLVVESHRLVRSNLPEAISDHRQQRYHIASLPLRAVDGGTHTSHVEKSIDESQQSVALLLDDAGSGGRLLLVTLGVGLLQLSAESLYDGERSAKLVGDIGEELLTGLLQLEQPLVLHPSQVVDVRHNGYHAKQHQCDDGGSNEDEPFLLSLLTVLLLQLVIMKTGVGSTQCIVEGSIVNGVGHAAILTQRIDGQARLVRLIGFGQRLVVIAHRAQVAHLTLQVNGTQQDGHSLGIAFHVEQVIGLILQADGEQVAIGNLHLLDSLHGLAGSLQPSLVVALTVVGIAELRQVVDHAGLKPYVAGSVDSLLSVADGLVDVTCIAVDFAGDAQDVVGVIVHAQLPVSFDGFLHEQLGLVHLWNAVVDNGQIEIGSGQLQLLSVIHTERHSFLLGLGSLGQLALLVETIAPVAEQHGVISRIVVLSQRQGTIDIVETLGEVSMVIIEALCRKEHQEID